MSRQNLRGGRALGLAKALEAVHSQALSIPVRIARTAIIHGIFFQPSSPIQYETGEYAHGLRVYVRGDRRQIKIDAEVKGVVYARLLEKGGIVVPRSSPFLVFRGRAGYPNPGQPVFLKKAVHRPRRPIAAGLLFLRTVLALWRRSVQQILGKLSRELRPLIKELGVALVTTFRITGGAKPRAVAGFISFRLSFDISGLTRGKGRITRLVNRIANEIKSASRRLGGLENTLRA